MRVQSNGIEIELDDQGPPGAEPLLMLMGLGMQLIAWPEEFVQMLVARGFRVLRIDNRDAGLSSGFDAFGVPNLPWAMMRQALHLPVHAPYSLDDMAADALGVIDALGLGAVHVCGASMGGMIAQHLTARHATRVRSLTLMMTSSGARHLPSASPAARRTLILRPDGGDPEAVVVHLERVWRTIGSPGYPPDPERTRRRLQASVARAWRPAGTARQLMAVVADGDRTALLARIAAPTCVIHGEDDPLIPVAAGRDLVRHIEGARADFIPGMGHDLPLELLSRFADDIAQNAARSRIQRS